MIVHGNAKLGPAGRCGAGAGDRGWDDAEGGRGRLLRVARDRPPVVAQASDSDRRGAVLGCLGVGSLQPPASKPAAA